MDRYIQKIQASGRIGGEKFDGVKTKKKKLNKKIII